MMMKTANRGRSRRDTRSEGPQFDVRVVRSNKVFKTTKGGKTASWSVLVVVGDNKGQVGVGLGKARSIADAIRKGEEVAKKSFYKVPMITSTITHGVRGTWGGTTIILRPASPGTGVKAGGATRLCLEVAGVHNVLSKCIGSRNAINMARATLEALRQLKNPEAFAAMRGLDVNDLMPWLSKARKEEEDAAS